MPAVQLSPLLIQHFDGNDGEPLVGGKLFTYAAGTTTKLATYTDSSGGTPNTNPVILDSRGEANVWMQAGLAYKFVLSPATDTDPPTDPIWTEDNILGIPSVAAAPVTYGPVAVAGLAYALPSTPMSSFLQVFLDGQLQLPANYNLVGNILTFTGLVMTEYQWLQVSYV